MRRVLMLVVLAWSALSVVVATAAAAAPTGRTGWHGETMPAGLERGETEGEYRWKKDGSAMVYVPPGPFLMGSETGDKDERPVHEVVLDGYYIDKYEVSWGQWKLSGLPYTEVMHSRLRQPKPPDWGIIDDHPVINTNWQEAERYAAWAGKRLPTEAEWEKAARGTDGRTYPWGNAPPTYEHAVWKGHPIAEESTAPVDCCAAGASPYGVHNMAGNVYEWCADVYEKDFYARAPRHNPKSEGPGPYRVLRGGAFTHEKEDLRSALRYRLLEIDRTPYMGLRTVLSGEK